jgi:hypothetical protein
MVANSLCEIPKKSRNPDQEDNQGDQHGASFRDERIVGDYRSQDLYPGWLLEKATLVFKDGFGYLLSVKATFFLTKLEACRLGLKELDSLLAQHGS